MKNTDKKYLRMKGNNYQFQLSVPRALKRHPMFGGKQVFIKSLRTGDLRVARQRRDQLLSEIDLLADGSKAAEFRAYVDQLKGFNKQFVKDNPDFDLSYYSLEYEGIEREARRRGIRLDENGHLPEDLPADLKFKLDAASQASGEDISDDAVPVPSAYKESLRDIMKRTIKVKELQGNKKKTIQKYSRSVEAFLHNLKMDDIPIAAIRRRQVVEFSQTMQARYSGSTVGNHLSFLSEIWKVARDLEMLGGDNPFRGHRVKDDKESYIPWTAGQLKVLYELLPDSDKLPFKIAVYTGARLDEIMTMKPEDVTSEETDDGSLLCLHIKPDGDGKTKSATRLIPIHSALADDLNDFEGFSGTSDAYSKRFGRVKKTYLGENNSRRYSFHSTRHTLATALHQSGVDELIISYITGHSGIGRTEASRTYIHGPLLRQMSDAIERLPVVL